MEFIILENDARGRERAERLSRQRSSTSLRSSDIALCDGTFRLVSRTFESEFAAHFEGDRALVLLGTHRAAPATLHRELRHYRKPEDVFAIYRRISGSYFTVLAWGGEVFVFGTLSGRCRVLVHAEDRLVASDGDVLRRVCDLTLDDDHLPLMLLMMQPASLLNERMPWRGVRGVRCTDAVVLRAGGMRTAARWNPPSATVRLNDGASHMRKALADAVGARHGRGRVSTDLSGGMDSTTVAFFAHRISSDLITVFRPGVDQANDDQVWTQRAIQDLPGVEHIEIPVNANQPWFSNWLDPATHSIESPLPSSRTSDYLRMLAAAVASAGSMRHLTGIGGDELYHPSFSLIREHSRTHRAWAVRAARAAQAMGRWSTKDTIRALYSRESYDSWRRRMAASLTAPPELRRLPQVDWEPRPLLPPWVTDSATEQVREILVRDAGHGGPSWGVSQHETLSLITLSGSLIRRFSPLFEAQGITYEAPLLDDHLIELALSIDPADRIQGAAYKPVLSAGASGVVPEGLLERQTKGDYSREAFAGVRHSRAAILDEFERSELVTRDLIDLDQFRTALSGVHTNTRIFQFLDPTLTAEAWLRQVSQALQKTETT